MRRENIGYCPGSSPFPDTPFAKIPETAAGILQGVAAFDLVAATPSQSAYFCHNVVVAILDVPISSLDENQSCVLMWVYEPLRGLLPRAVNSPGPVQTLRRGTPGFGRSSRRLSRG